MQKITFFSILIIFFSCKKDIDIETEEYTSEIVIYENFESTFVDARNVEVFLPSGYDQNTSEKYQVLYMHDGQNVFNPKTSFTGIDWGVDEAIDNLMKTKEIKKTIVVAVWNNNRKRFAEYMPQAPAEASETEEAKELLLQYTGIDHLLSDNYLKFIVEELKPFIDKEYNVYQDAENTFIMGSSMGGLISLYAISKYPAVFGGAGCISTHWPVQTLGPPYIASLPESLPDPETHKLYFDYGTKTLDAKYEPYQKQVDVILRSRGYKENENWVSKKFEGADHSEKSWKARIHIPLKFLLNN